MRPGELDAERFARGVAEGRRALEAGDPQRAGVVLREALGLWHGPALAELEFEPFAAAEIARLEEQRLRRAGGARGGRPRARGARCAGERAAAAAGRAPDARAAARLQLMLALYRSGRQAEALEVYRDARQILVEDAGIEPGAELQRLHAAILRQDPSLDLPTRGGVAARARRRPTAPRWTGRAGGAASERRSALPASPNRTIGRARDELGSVAERLRVGLGSLVDPDRTRRCRQDTAGARGRARRRARLRRRRAPRVARARLSDPRTFPRAIVSALAIMPLAGESAEQAVERFLAAKHLLLVVDNCEHLPGAARVHRRLAAACPDRHGAGHEPRAARRAGRALLPRAAARAAGARDRTGDAIADVDAVALFCERARAHDPDFELERRQR